MQMVFIETGTSFNKFEDKINEYLRQGWFVKDIKTDSYATSEREYSNYEFLIIVTLEHV